MKCAQHLPLSCLLRWILLFVTIFDFSSLCSFFVENLNPYWIRYFHLNTQHHEAALASCVCHICWTYFVSKGKIKNQVKVSVQTSQNIKSEHYSFACTEKLLNCMKLELMEDLCVLRVCLCSPSSSRSPWCRGGHVTHYCLVAAGNCSASSQIHNLHMIMIYF